MKTSKAQRKRYKKLRYQVQCREWLTGFAEEGITVIQHTNCHLHVSGRDKSIRHDVWMTYKGLKWMPRGTWVAEMIGFTELIDEVHKKG